MMSRSGSWSPVGPAGRGRRGDVRRSRGDVRRSRVARILARLATPGLVGGRAVATDRRGPGWTVLSGGRSGAQRGGGRGRLMDGGTDTGGAAEGTMVELARDHDGRRVHGRAGHPSGGGGGGGGHGQASPRFGGPHFRGDVWGDSYR